MTSENPHDSAAILYGVSVSQPAVACMCVECGGGGSVEPHTSQFEPYELRLRARREVRSPLPARRRVSPSFHRKSPLAVRHFVAAIKLWCVRAQLLVGIGRLL